MWKRNFGVVAVGGPKRGAQASSACPHRICRMKGRGAGHLCGRNVEGSGAEGNPCFADAD